MAERTSKIQLPKTCKRHGIILPESYQRLKSIKSRNLFFILSVFATLLISSCRNINSNILFKIPKGDDFKYDSIPLVPEENFKIAPGDRFSFMFGTNDGEKIILSQSGVQNTTNGNIQSSSNSMQNPQRQITYLVRQDGTSNLPVLGSISVAEKTIVELEEEIRLLLSENYINPFVQIRVTNQRVIIFPGKGDAQVVGITNANTSLLEAIALAGGIRNEGRANSIKLMRKTKTGQREIYKIDLSTIDGLNHAQMIVQSNDYIYVDFKPRIAAAFLTEVMPWLSLITTSILTYSIISTL
ncbi:polysaccharide biosynthesis/export family protein [Crocinitomicaceae bacterium]|nr:polysaccharide biosynthesis/export family protein [Crocinitomicaceae bacterium]